MFIGVKQGYTERLDLLTIHEALSMSLEDLLFLQFTNLFITLQYPLIVFAKQGLLLNKNTKSIYYPSIAKIGKGLSEDSRDVVNVKIVLKR